METMTLTHADTRRLERIARDAGRTPRVVLKFVLRDGFEATERAIAAVKSRMADGRRIPHAEAMHQLDAMTATRAGAKKKGLTGTPRPWPSSPSPSSGIGSAVQ